MRDSCDVLIIGGGGAALRAALAAHEHAPDLDILLVTKGRLGQSGVTATACSDRMAFHATLPSTEPDGLAGWQYHAQDIYRIGGEVSDADLAEILAQRAYEAFVYLDQLGVPWARRLDGAVDQFITDGSAYARACYTGPYTANHIEQALLKALSKTPVRILEGHMIAELLLDPSSQRIIGAAAISETNDRIRAISCKAAILATGGAGQVFAENVYPPDCTGDGYAIAFRAGAELVNLEFIQIGLCSVKTGLACSGSMMRALPRLVDEKGRELLPLFFGSKMTFADIYRVLFAKGASWPVSFREPSHIIDIAVSLWREQGHRVFLDYGRNPLGLDLKELGPEILSWYTQHGKDLEQMSLGTSPLARLRAINSASIDWLAEHGINLDHGDKIEIAPAIQHFQGGVKIRTRAETAIPGLFAAGEVAGGQHGANRPGGNALLDSQVFGRIAGEQAADWARVQSPSTISLQQARRAINCLFEGGKLSPQVRDEIRQAMSLSCGVRRTTEGLESLVAKLGAWQRQGISAKGEPLYQAVETLNILQTARLIARAALLRQESRGPHLRFSEQDPLHPLPRDDRSWRRYVVLRRRGTSEIEWRLVEPVRPSLPLT